MIRTNITSKPKKKVTFVFSVILSCLVFFFVGGIAHLSAQTVPQEVGFKDIDFANFTKTSCIGCHGEGLVDDHHNTQPALAGDCAACHKVSTETGNVGVALERDCMACHKKSPHHTTEAAVNNECNSCHESPGLSEFSNEVPPYKPSKITPTVASCRNCHGEGEVDGVKIGDPKKTHHGISLKGCNVCHDTEDKRSQNIRICERCHSAKALHEVVAHVQKENCVKCHEVKK